MKPCEFSKQIIAEDGDCDHTYPEKLDGLRAPLF